VNESVSNPTTEEFGPVIQLTEAQRAELQNALLSAGKPSSQAKLLPRMKGKRKYRRLKQATCDRFLILTGIL
jgi:hypothetical protein